MYRNFHDTFAHLKFIEQFFSCRSLVSTSRSDRCTRQTRLEKAALLTMGCTQPRGLLQEPVLADVSGSGRDFREQLVCERTDDVFLRYEFVKELEKGESRDHNASF